MKSSNEIFKTGNGIILCTSRPYDQITSFAKCFTFSPRSSALYFKKGNRIIKIGNGIIVIKLQENPGRLPILAGLQFLGT